VQDMADGEQRVGEEHTRAGESHDLADVFAAGRRIAVNGASGAGWFVLSEGAVVEAGKTVLKKIITIGAKSVITIMLTAAIKPDHSANGPLLDIDPGWAWFVAHYSLTGNLLRENNQRDYIRIEEDIMFCT